MLCVLWFCLFHNCSSFVMFWRPKHSKHSQKKKKKNTTELLGWVKSFAACLLCTRFSVNWTEKDLRRSEQQLLHSSPGDLCNPSKQSPPKKPRKKNNKNLKNLTSSSLSLYLHQKQTQKHQNKNTHKFSKTKSNHKNLKNTHTTSPKLPPQKSAAKECMYKIFSTLFCIYHLPQSLTKIHKPTKISQLLYTQRKKKKKKNTTKHTKELKDRREKRESLTRVYTRSI